MSFFNFLFGRKGNTKKSIIETFEVDGKSITTKSSEAGEGIAPDYKLSNLTTESINWIAEKLNEAELLIIKYNGELPNSKYDANLLDKVLEEWRKSLSPEKETPEFVVEALGAALGQDLVDSLDCQWQVLVDEYGSDLTVVHKIHKINAFPFSSAKKAYTENKIDNFQSIKLALKHHIQKQDESGMV